MSNGEDIDSKVSMLHRDLTELRVTDRHLETLFSEQREATSRMACVLEEHGRELAKISASLPKMTIDIDYLKSQHTQLFEQSMRHGELLLKHAELHTRHAESIGAVREEVREVKQRSSDLSQEWTSAASAIDAHVKQVSAGHKAALARVVEGQEQAARAALAEAADRKLQTKALGTLAKVVTSPRVAAYITFGAIVGGFVAALFGKVL